jgi:hypothetical protein
MAGTVWCVFQKLPDEKCPSLSAVCRTRSVADATVESSRREERGSGLPESEWIIQEWTVMDRKTEHDAEQAEQISHVLDPMRAGVLPGDGPDEEE